MSSEVRFGKISGGLLSWIFEDEYHLFSYFRTLWASTEKMIHCIDFNHFTCTALFDFSKSFQGASHQ
jgi:hypothetical protein